MTRKKTKMLYTICSECAVIAAIICFFSGVLTAILGEFGYLSLTQISFSNDKNFWLTTFYIGCFSAFIGAFLGIVTGYLSCLFNRSFWNEESS